METTHNHSNKKVGILWQSVTQLGKVLCNKCQLEAHSSHYYMILICRTWLLHRQHNMQQCTCALCCRYFSINAKH